MDFEEFKFLINRITVLSDKASGLKTQNKILQQKITSVEYKNQQLEIKNRQLAEKITEVNHKLQKCIKENHELRGINETECRTPGGVHGKINITELK